MPTMDEVVPSGTQTSVTPRRLFRERTSRNFATVEIIAQASKSVEPTFSFRITGAFSHTGDHQRVATLFLFVMLGQKPAAGHYGVFLIAENRAPTPAIC